MTRFSKSALTLAVVAAAGFGSSAHANSLIDITSSITTGATDDATTNAGDPAEFNLDADGADILGRGTSTAGAISVERRVSQAGAVTLQLGDELNTSNLNGSGRSVLYSSQVALADGLTLEFETQNGAIEADNNLALVAFDRDETANDGSGEYIQVGSLNDFNTGNGGYTDLVIQLDLEAAKTADSSFLNQDEQISQDTPLALVKNNGGTVSNPEFIMNQGLAVGESVSIDLVAATNSSGVALNAPLAGKQNIGTVVDAIALATEQVTSTIDVEFEPSSRAGFEAVHQGGAATSDDTNSVAIVKVDLNDQEYEDDGVTEVTIDAANYSLDLSRDNTNGVEQVSFSGNTTDELTDDTYSLNGTNFADLIDLNAGENLGIKVNGDNVLETGNWLSTLTIEPTGLTSGTLDGDGDVDAFELDSDSHIWDINGAQFKIPYHAQNASGYNFFMKTVNETTNDATVFADLIIENLSEGTRDTIENVEIGTAAAEGNTTIGQDAIREAAIQAGAAINNDDLFHVAMTVTVLAPRNLVQVAAFQSDSKGRTEVPVYLNTGNEGDARVWQR